MGPTKDVQYRVEQAVAAKEEAAPSRSKCKNYSAGGHTVLHVLSSDVFFKNSFAELHNPMLHIGSPEESLRILP